ncbi:MAG: hypothetical protein FJ144_00750 [Deltaproteobacteria bacterium]|nr:hypothetical protein [Deltaproteobacteria bacterium]
MKKFLGTMTALAVALSASSVMAATYLAGDLLPSEFGGGWISPSPTVFKDIGKAAGAGSKLASGAAKCYSKGAGNASKNKPSGVGPCINNSKKGVIPKYLASIGALANLPPCHNYAGDAGFINGLVKLFNPMIYCQSPSGAFLDGASF